MSLFLLAGVLAAQNPSSDWIQPVREAINQKQLAVALDLVDHRLAEQPADWEAHGWRGRLLAWTGHWQDAEAEYRLVLDHVPHDSEITATLADVLIWQQKYQEALAVLDQARAADPANPEILLRRAKVLSLLNQYPEARSQYRAILRADPNNQPAAAGLGGLKRLARNELRLGGEADFFSYTKNANAQAISLLTHWNQRWITGVAVNSYYLFGQNAVKFSAEVTRQFRGSNWVRVQGAGANPQDVVPEGEVLVEYGHGFRLSNPVVKGWETSYQEHSFWYGGARVLTLGSSQTLYFPKEWTWNLSVLGAQTCFAAGACDWVPSASTKVGFPVRPSLFGNVMFAVGAEDFAQVDQIGRLSARTYGGGLRFHFAENQDISGFFARQSRERGQTQSALGLNYGLRF